MKRARVAKALGAAALMGIALGVNSFPVHAAAGLVTVYTGKSGTSYNAQHQWSNLPADSSYSSYWLYLCTFESR